MKLIGFILFFFLAFPLFAATNEVDKTEQAREWLKNQPLTFIENKGQFADSEGNPADNVLFKASYGNCDIYITTSGLSYVFSKYENAKGKSKDTIDVHRIPTEKVLENRTVSYYRLDMNLQGSAIDKSQVVKELPGKQGVTNYFYPHCPEGIYGVQEYGKITIKNIYKGIDWVIYTNAGNKESPLKYDFVVQPKANYKDIKIKFINAQSTSLTNNGTKLKIQTIAGNIEEGNLYSYLQNSTEKQAIKTNYKANADSTLEFEIGAYDKTKTLVIDPLVWATYYGSWEFDNLYSICSDSQDNIYITGFTSSRDFPTLSLVGAYWQAPNVVSNEAIIIKFNNRGIRQWATYYSGNGDDYGQSIYCDNKDNIFITGGTSSTVFPIQELTGSFYQQNNAGSYDAFILKFNNQGVRQWATFYGGIDEDRGQFISGDNDGNIILTGNTYSTDFPIKQSGNAYYQVNNGGRSDVFILKFNNSGARLWATYYGGYDIDLGYSISTDKQNNIYITGSTQSGDFPTMELPGAYYQKDQDGYADAFILKLNNLGILQWSTHYGGFGVDYGTSICLDNQNNIYLTGTTTSIDFPVQELSGAFFQQYNAGDRDVFISKFNSSGIHLWATYYGGMNSDFAIAICCDKQNNIYVTGQNYFSDFPTHQMMGEFWQTSNAGLADVFMLKFSKKGIQQWGTLYGGTGYDEGTGICIDNENSVYFIGQLMGTAYTLDYGNGAYFNDIYVAVTDGYIFKMTSCNNQIPDSLTTDRNKICINDNGNITLNAIGGVGDTLKWYSDNLCLNSIGKGTHLIIPSPIQTTTYYARWESLCDTSACDSVVINIYTQITQNISPIICQGDTCFVGTSKYTIAGIYTDILPTASGCDSIINTNLTLNPVIQSGQGQSICEGDSFIFATHIYTLTGVYEDTLTSLVSGCDSLITTNLTVNPKFLTLQSPSICEGEFFAVGTHIYTTTGTYTDALKTVLGCDSIVTTDLTVNPVPVVSLGDDLLICPGDTIILSPGEGFISYLWSDGSVLSKLMVLNPGTYTVTAYNEWCPASDEIAINECGTELWFPNAFSPNNDGINERFKPVILGTLNTYQILIFNRWGQQIYQSNNAYAGWDGVFNGSPCADGLYVYIATYTMGAEPATQKQRVQRGTVTLLR